MYSSRMAVHQFTRPNATTYPLEDLVGEVLAGGVRIPDFQRAFRWQWDDAKRLLDSIVRGYPIGSLLLWSRPASAARLSIGALTIDAPAKDEALWVVDGQQRLTSLASALNDPGTRDPRFAIGYDLARQAFVKPTEERPLFRQKGARTPRHHSNRATTSVSRGRVARRARSRGPRRAS